MQITKRANVFSVIFLSFIFFALFSNYSWIKHDNSVRGDGSQNCLLFSIEFFYLLSDILQQETSSLWTKVTHCIQLLGVPPGHKSIYWPNGLNLTTFAFYSFFGKSLLSAKLSLFPYILILLISTYWIGRLMASEFIGIVASFILFMYPMIFESSRQFQLDLPLTSMAALDIFLLMKCDGFKRTKYSVLFGLSLGWSMLIKGQIMLFMIGPLLVVGYKILKNLWNPSVISLRQFQNIFIFTMISGLIASVWWGHHVGKAIQLLADHIFSPQPAMESFYHYSEKYSVDKTSYQLRALFHYSIGPFLFFALVFSLVLFLKQGVRYKNILMSWLLIPLLLFSFVFTAKDIRFLMPILPVSALITSWGINQIQNRIQKGFFLSVTIAFSLAQFCLLSYSPQKAKSVSIGSFRLLGIQGRFTGADYGRHPPTKDEIRAKEVVGIMRRDIPLSHPIQVGSITVHGKRPSTLELVYWLRMEDRHLTSIDLTEMHIKFLKNFDSLDYILFYSLAKNSSLQWPAGEEFQRLLDAQHGKRISTLTGDSLSQWNQLLKILEASRHDFQLAGTITVSNSGICYIYKRIR